MCVYFFPRLHVSLRFCLSYFVFLFSPSCAVSPASFSGLCLQPNSVYFIVPLNQALWSPRVAANFQTALGMFPLSSSCKPIVISSPCSSLWAYHNLELAGISYLSDEIGIPHNIILQSLTLSLFMSLSFSSFPLTCTRIAPTGFRDVQGHLLDTKKVLGHCSSWKTSLS